MNNKPAIAEQSIEHVLWMNGMLETQNEVLMQTCADLRMENQKLQKEIENLKTAIAVLKRTVQRISGVM